LLHYLFVYVADLGFVGAPISSTISTWLIVISLGIFIGRSSRFRETWNGWSKECLYDWGVFVRLAIPGMAMICIEWWSFEVSSLLSGLLGTAELAAQGII